MVTRTRKEIESQLLGHREIFVDVIEKQWVLSEDVDDDKTETKKTAIVLGTQAVGTGVYMAAALTGAVAASLVPFLALAVGASLFGAVKAAENVDPVKKTVYKEVDKIVKKFSHTEEIREDREVTVEYQEEIEQFVGRQYLSGGYAVASTVLALGLGIELATQDGELVQNFQSVVDAGYAQIEKLIGRRKQRIDRLAETSPPDKAEQQIIALLEAAILS